MPAVKNYLKAATLFLIFIYGCGNTFAQLTGWSFKDAVQVQNSGVLKLNYQVLLTVNTQTLIASGKMQNSGNDIRFAKNCSGSILYDYWIESGINTANTKIWVKIDSLPANLNRILYMYYGNSTATVTASFANTFPNQKIVAATEVPADTVWNYDWVEIQSAATVTVNTAQLPGRLVINARKILIAGILEGNALGYLGAASGNGSGPGGGSAPTGGSYGGGGGGGYGAAGGAGCANGGTGGIAYGTNNVYNIAGGSGGGAPAALGSGAVGGNGGGYVVLNGTSVEISGTVRVEGAAGTGGGSYNAGGGGSGGGVIIKSGEVKVTGTISAKGGAGGTPGVVSLNYYGGGGGAGGRIKIFYDNSNYTYTGINAVAGGAAGQSNPCCSHSPAAAGGNGTFYNGTFVSGFPIVTITPGSTANAGNDETICTGGSAVLGASGGIAYSWSPAAGLSATNISNPVASPASTTTYAVTVTDANGCTGTDNITVFVDPCTGIPARPAGGLSSNENMNVSIFPNPTTGKIQIQLAPDSHRGGNWQLAGSQSVRTPSEQPTASVEIYNVMGEKIAPSNSPKGGGFNSLPSGGLGWAFDISSHPPGIYFLKAFPPDSYREAIGTEKGLSIHKIIKQ